MPGALTGLRERLQSLLITVPAVKEMRDGRRERCGNPRHGGLADPRASVRGGALEREMRRSRVRHPQAPARRAAYPRHAQQAPPVAGATRKLAHRSHEVTRRRTGAAKNIPAAPKSAPFFDSHRRSRYASEVSQLFVPHSETNTSPLHSHIRTVAMNSPSLHSDSDVAVIQLDNPPVNALSHATRTRSPTNSRVRQRIPPSKPSSLRATPSFSPPAPT